MGKTSDANGGDGRMIIIVVKQHVTETKLLFFSDLAVAEVEVLPSAKTLAEALPTLLFRPLSEK